MCKFKYLLFILLVTVFSAGVLNAQETQKEFPILKGKYLGQKPPGKIPVIFAPGIISTELHDDGPPFFNKVGDELFFRIVGHVDKKPMGVFFQMKKKNGIWPAPVPAPFSGKYMDGTFCYSPDESRIYFSSMRPVEGTGKELKKSNIWYVDRKNNGWSEAKLMNISVNKHNPEGGFTISGKGNMFISLNIPGGFGDSDIYKLEYRNGKFEEPENPGSNINTAGFEGAPLIERNENYLIHMGLKADKVVLFASFRKKDDSWTKAVSFSDRFYDGSVTFPGLSPDGKYLFFVGHKKEKETNPAKKWKTGLFKGTQVNWGGDVYWVDAKVIDEFRPVDQ